MKSCILTIFLLTGIAAYSQPTEKIKTLPVLYQQTAAEYRALCYQAFNIASLRLNAIVHEKKKGRPLAIITDLDETILDNSYSEAKLIKEGKEYSSAGWKDWTDRSAATAVPGAVAFLQEARKKGVSIFYISNRNLGEVNSTLRNLQMLQLPDTDTMHMLFLDNTSSKEARRLKVMAKYNVVMLLGDNLNDFMNIFERKNIDDRFTETDKMRAEWGKKFIVLPNATYGEWENALYNYGRNLSKQQKDSMLLGLLKGY
jgi:5'-nucleotidase (lipoprotein e(P4) family)